MSNALVMLLGTRSRRIKHRALTAAQWAVLEQQADLLVKLIPQKTIARELKISRSYVAQSLGRLVQERRGNVPRLTHVFTLAESEVSGTITG